MAPTVVNLKVKKIKEEYSPRQIINLKNSTMFRIMDDCSIEKAAKLLMDTHGLILIRIPTNRNLGVNLTIVQKYMKAHPYDETGVRVVTAYNGKVVGKGLKGSDIYVKKGSFANAVITEY